MSLELLFTSIKNLQAYSARNFASDTIDGTVEIISGDPQGSTVWLKLELFWVFLEVLKNLEQTTSNV